MFGILLILLMFISPRSFAFDQQKKNSQALEDFSYRDKMMRDLMNGDQFDLNQIEKRMRDMMKDFDEDDFFSRGSAFFPRESVTKMEWVEENDELVLHLKAKLKKNAPLDIKIENGLIKIKGEGQTDDAKSPASQHRMIFERQMTLPAGIDASNPKYETTDTGIKIRFKKLKETTNLKRSVVPSLPKNRAPQIQQIEKEIEEENEAERVPEEFKKGPVI